MITWPPVIGSVAAAAVCAAAVSIYGWEDARTWLLPALSIVAAAVLVRLARGVPFTNPDHIREEDVEAVTAAFISLSTSLRSLFFVVLGTMVVVGAASPLARLMAELVPVDLDLGNRLGSALVGLCVAYSFVRMLQIAQSDVSITKLQARVIRDSVARRRAKKFAEDEMKPSTFRQPEGYGKPLQ